MPLGQSVHQSGAKESARGHAMNRYMVPGTRPSPYNKGEKLQRREVLHRDPQRYVARKNTRDNGKKTKHINVLTVCMRDSGWIEERIVRTRKLPFTPGLSVNAHRTNGRQLRLINQNADGLLVYWCTLPT